MEARDTPDSATVTSKAWYTMRSCVIGNVNHYTPAWICKRADRERELGKDMLRQPVIFFDSIGANVVEMPFSTF